MLLLLVSSIVSVVSCFAKSPSPTTGSSCSTLESAAPYFHEMRMCVCVGDEEDEVGSSFSRRLATDFPTTSSKPKDDVQAMCWFDTA